MRPGNPLTNPHAMVKSCKVTERSAHGVIGDNCSVNCYDVICFEVWPTYC